MHIARVGERLPRLQIQFWISRSFRPRNLANLRSKIRFWIRRKEHTPRFYEPERLSTPAKPCQTLVFTKTAGRHNHVILAIRAAC